jgi:hypothetical protein
MHARTWAALGLCLTGGVAAAQDIARETIPALEELATLDAGTRVDFSDEVRPILSDKCFACHGPDAATRKANLRLDLQEAAFAPHDGSAPVVPGDVRASAIMQRIATPDTSDVMPPHDSKKPITAEEAKVLARWILQGAEWEGHWAFETPKRPDLPDIEHTYWPQTPIDYFIIDRLEQEGLSHAEPADRRTLIRRLSLDLTGLPPAPEEIHDFVNDSTDSAYNKVVDRLLASPRYGEHMARYWLDAARYADTNGYHIDNERYMWRWRDWVIDSFNRNQPFDQFTIEQLAGDLLPNATLEQKIASGFNRNHMVNFEGGAIPEEYRVAYVVDRVNTTGTVWLGLTVGCAQCHSHKYDPISMKEYYQLFSYFNTIEEQGLDGLKGNAAPVIEAPRAEDLAKLEELTQRLEVARAALEAPDPALDEAQAAWERETFREQRQRWKPARVSRVASAGGAELNLFPDGSVIASGPNPDDEVYTIELETRQKQVTAIQLEALRHESLQNGTGRAPNANFVLTGITLESAPLGTDAWRPVGFATARADFEQPNFPVTNAIDNDPATGWAVQGDARKEDRTAWFTPAQPLMSTEGLRLRVTLRHESKFKQHAIGRFRIRVSEDAAFVPSKSSPWYLNGPYTAEDGKAAFATAFAPEQVPVDLAARDADGRNKWNQLMQATDGAVLPLESLVGANYLYREIDAPTARSYAVDFASNDALKVWLNGQVVLEIDEGRAITPGQYDRVELPLQQGKNRLLVKVVNYGNKHEFYYAGVGEQPDMMPMEVQAAITVRAAQRTEEQKHILTAYYRAMHSPQWAEQKAAVDALEAELKAFREAMPTTMVMAEMAEPRETFILARGQYDQPTEKVEPGLPAALPPLREGVPNNRLGLAMWLVDPANPLTARVTVNRIWQQFFGTGLVKTAEDFGMQGEAPSHPELLDWLAVDFMESGWDIKRLVKMIVCSAAYMQDSRIPRELLERDPENRLIARGPRYRLDAEVIRDSALAASGLLVEKVGGPSAKPYQPAGIWEESAYGENFTAQRYEQDKGEGLYRRTMYTFWKRQVPPPGLLNFDAPNREVCAVRRPRTNTPLQALELMNNPQYVEAARFLAERMIREGGETPEQRIARGFELGLGRTPKVEETAVLVRMYAAQREKFAANVEACGSLLKIGDKPPSEGMEPEELAAWTTVASALLNLDEAITKL